MNFGRDTLAILNEVKHLSKDFPKREVPERAREVFRRFDDLRNYNNSLEQVDMTHNIRLSQTVWIWGGWVGARAALTSGAFNMFIF